MAYIKKNDTVIVTQGKDKNKTGKVVNIGKDKIVVQGINLIKKAVKPKSQQEKGGIISIEAPIHISNVMLVSKGKKTRVGIKIENGKKERVSKKTGEVL